MVIKYSERLIKIKLFDIFNNKLLDTQRLTIELKDKQAKPLNYSAGIIQSYLSFISVDKLSDINFNHNQLLEVYTRHQGSKKQYINSMVKGKRDKELAKDKEILVKLKADLSREVISCHNNHIVIW